MFQFLNGVIERRQRSGYEMRVMGRYFCVDCLGGVAFVCSCVRFGCGSLGILSMKGTFAFFYLGILTIIALIDWDTRMIDDRFHLMILLLGVAAVWVFPEYTLVQRLVGIVIIALPMLLLAMVIPGAFGGGDIKLMAVSGWLLGWRAMLPAAFLGLLFGSGFCIRMLAQRRFVRKDSFSFGPFLALGLAISFFYGDAILKWYLSI